MSPCALSSFSEPELDAGGQHVDVLASAREVELVAVPVGADLDGRRNGESHPRSVRPAPTRLAPTSVSLDGGVEGRPHIGAAVEPAQLAEGAEALAERNARDQRE